MIAGRLIMGSVNSKIFTNFVTDSVLPNIGPETKILLDNARIHSSEYFRETMKVNGITEDRIVYNVPYSPKYNPIEYSFNTQKKLAKEANITSLPQLVQFLESYDSITKNSYENYFKKSFDHLFNDENY